MKDSLQINQERLAPLGSFKRSEQEVLIQGMQRPLIEKLKWLEQACEFADELKAAKRSQGTATEKDSS